MIKDRVPISIVPRDQVPFSHLYMDVVGPLLNKAEYNFCLCLIDSHTRFPFAFPLRSVNAKAVCECLLQVFSLVGIPSVITSDNATYFTSQLNDKFMELFGCKPRFSTVLHPEGNSLVERMNASLEKMLARISQKYPKQWYKLLPFVLWCMRESRNETLGVSPFMMVMGCNPANPLKILKDTWTGENQLPQTVGKNLFLNFWLSYKLKFRKFMIMRMIMLMLNNRDTLISIIREQSTNIFRLVNRSLF